METERLLIDPIRETDKADYFRNISHLSTSVRQLERAEENMQS